MTFWITNAGRLATGPVDKRIAQLMMWLNGTIPDGMLFRVSSLDTDTDRAFTMQQQFAADLLARVDPGLRKRLSGLGPAPLVVDSLHPAPLALAE